MGDDHPKLTKKIHELESSLNSERNKNKCKVEEMDNLRQQAHKLQQELDSTRKMYEECRNDMKNNVTAATAMKEMEDLENEIKHFKIKNAELADELATKERTISEISCQIEALQREKTTLTETCKDVMQGNTNINL